MKNISKLGFMLLSLVFFTACEKDENEVVLSSDAEVEASLSTSNLVLLSEKAEEKALSISWEMKKTEVSLAPSYTINFKNGENMITISAEKSPLELTTKRLNALLTDLKLETEKPTDIQIEVVSSLSEFFKITSNTNTLNVTTYKDVVDLSTEWGVVGTINGWGGSPDTPFWKVIGNNDQYVAYVNVEADGEIKFRKNQDWGENYGDDGANGSLESGAANIKISKGLYRILWNISDNTYSLEKYTWGIIGSAGNGWGDNDDIPLSYNGIDNVWEAQEVALKDGEFKFRFNNSWSLNYGDNGADGTLEEGGDNIKITAGTYDIVVDFSGDTPKYKVIAK